MSCLVALCQMEEAAAQLVLGPVTPPRSLYRISILWSDPGRLYLWNDHGCILNHFPTLGG